MISLQTNHKENLQKDLGIDEECAQYLLDTYTMMHPDEEIDPERIGADVRSVAFRIITEVGKYYRDYDFRYETTRGGMDRQYAAITDMLPEEERGIADAYLPSFDEESVRKWTKTMCQAAGHLYQSVLDTPDRHAYHLLRRRVPLKNVYAVARALWKESETAAFIAKKGNYYDLHEFMQDFRFAHPEEVGTRAYLDRRPCAGFLSHDIFFVLKEAVDRGETIHFNRNKLLFDMSQASRNRTLSVEDRGKLRQLTARRCLEGRSNNLLLDVCRYGGAEALEYAQEYESMEELGVPEKDRMRFLEEKLDERLTARDSAWITAQYRELVSQLDKIKGSATPQEAAEVLRNSPLNQEEGYRIAEDGSCACITTDVSKYTVEIPFEDNGKGLMDAIEAVNHGAKMQAEAKVHDYIQSGIGEFVGKRKGIGENREIIIYTSAREYSPYLNSAKMDGVKAPYGKVNCDGTMEYVGTAEMTPGQTERFNTHMPAIVWEGDALLENTLRKSGSLHISTSDGRNYEITNGNRPDHIRIQETDQAGKPLDNRGITITDVVQRHGGMDIAETFAFIGSNPERFHYYYGARANTMFPECESSKLKSGLLMYSPETVFIARKTMERTYGKGEYPPQIEKEFGRQLRDMAVNGKDITSSATCEKALNRYIQDSGLTLEEWSKGLAEAYVADELAEGKLAEMPGYDEEHMEALVSALANRMAENNAADIPKFSSAVAEEFFDEIYAQNVRAERQGQPESREELSADEPEAVAVGQNSNYDDWSNKR